MAYSELIKNFSRIRGYMREFYVYGFKSRSEYTKRSARSYDDERRRAESWLGDAMSFRQTAAGRNIFISIDSRACRHNPFYRAWKAMSFTDGDITLHFILFDILSSPDIALSLSDIAAQVDSYLSCFAEPRLFDESSIRKKLKEYAGEGLVIMEKRGRVVLYRRSPSAALPDADLLDFFSEVAPCGVIGSYLLDKTRTRGDRFTFKHHYITGALDSEIVCALLCAITDRQAVSVETVSRRGKAVRNDLVPLRIMVSVQNGRQYLMAYVPRFKRISSFRLDNILSVTPTGSCETFDTLRAKLDDMSRFMWGVSTQGRSGRRLEHVEFTVAFEDSEPFILERLEREKRCGTLERIDENTVRFSADVYDASEMIPWIRTFIGRITAISFSDARLEAQFRSDIDAAARLYGLEGGDPS